MSPHDVGHSQDSQQVSEMGNEHNDLSTGKQPQQSTSLLHGRSSKKFLDMSNVRHGRIAAWAKNAGLSMLAIWLGGDWKTEREPRKVILSDDVLTVLSRCWVHLLPLAATVVLTVLNSGYFIGNNLSGPTATTYQNLDRLGLQVASKILELLIIASTGKVVIAFVRHGLLRGSKGVPFGLLLARLNFTQISYLWDTAFICGVSSIQGRRRKILIALFIVLCAIIAAFSGPAAAFLMIPSYRYGWPGGGTDFILNGSASYYFPPTINSELIGPTECQKPGSGMINAETREVQTCLWCGYVSIKRYLKQRPLFWDSFGETYNITPVDPLISRQLTISQSSPWDLSTFAETWGTGTPRVVAAVNNYIMPFWVIAISEAAGRGISSYANFKWRDVFGGWRQTTTQLPAVRTQCFFWNDALSPGPVYKFPYLPLFEQHQYSIGGAPSSPFPDIHDVSAFSITLAPYSTSNGSITSQWISMPSSGPPTLSNGSQGLQFLSAMMAIRIPFANESSSGQTIACSVDARWAQGLLVSQSNRNMMNSLEGLRTTGRRQPGARSFSPIDGGSWRTVAFSTDWLQAITPQVSIPGATNATARSTIDDMLTDALLYSEESTTDQGRSWFQAGCNFCGNDSLRMWQPQNSSFGFCMAEVSTRAEVIITAVVLDAMSRVHSPSDPGGNVNESVSVGGWLSDGNQNTALLRGKASSQDFLGGDSDPTHVRLRWEVFISGYAYSIDGVAGVLALAILYLHVLVVVCHIGWMLWKRESSDAWEAPEEMVALAMMSEPPTDGVLENAAGGIRCRKTYQTVVRVRAHPNRFHTMTGTKNDVGMWYSDERRRDLTSVAVDEKVLPNRKY